MAIYACKCGMEKLLQMLQLAVIYDGKPPAWMFE